MDLNMCIDYLEKVIHHYIQKKTKQQQENKNKNSSIIQKNSLILFYSHSFPHS